jgi:hypothetical protein
MNWDLPTFVKSNDTIYAITNDCDYRVVLDVFCVLNDENLSKEEKIIVSLLIFYKDLTLENMQKCEDIEFLAKEMFRIISGGKTEQPKSKRPPIMDWEHDFSQIAPPISRVLGYDIRTPQKYTHYYTFLGGYQEIGECSFATIVSIRNKKQKAKKLEKWEQEFYNEHKEMVDLPRKLTIEEQEFLNSDW